MRYIAVLLGLMTLLLEGSASAQVDNTLPDSPWYAVLHAQADDTLHWINADGLQASRPRPRLPDERPGAQPAMRIAPDGRTLVITASLVNGREGIGFFDLQVGTFLATHTAQPGERIVPGLEDSAHGDQIAVGFAMPESGTWRLILFDLEDGSVVEQLRSDDPAAVVAPSGRVPQIVYYDGDSVHFHLRNDPTVRGQSDAAYSWFPADGVLMPGNVSNSSGDFLYSDSTRVFTFTDGRFETAPGPDGTANAVGMGEAANPITLDAGGTLAKEAPRWAAGGRWLAYRGVNANGIARWYVTEVNRAGVQPTQMPERMMLPAGVRAVLGTPEGLLVLHEDGHVSHILSMDASEGATVLEAGVGQSLRFLYVTPESVSFALGSVVVPDVDDEGTAEVQAQPTMPPCGNAPESRLQAGDLSQVTGSVPLRVRDAPGGNYVTEMPLGSQVTIVGGPECVNGFLWWRVRWQTSEGETVEGWSAEGAGSAYYLVPVMPTPTPSPTSSPSATPTPALSSRIPFAPPTITPTGRP